MSGDKKRIVPLAVVLGLVVVGMGVVQFTGGEDATPEPAKPASKRTEANNQKPPTTESNDPAQLAKLTPRNPFAKVGMPSKEEKEIVPEGAPTPLNRPTAGPGPRPRRNSPTSEFPSGLRPLPPPDSSFNPSDGGPPPPSEEPPALEVAGVVEGSRTVVLIREPGGGQRLAKVNDVIGGRYRVVSISRKGVVITSGSKSYTFTVGGAAGEKK